MAQPIDRSITFAGAGTQTVQVPGRFVRVLACDASGVTITPRPGSPLLRYAGQDVDAGVGGFTAVDLTVTVASTVKVCVSDTRQADSNTNVTANVSATVTPGGTMNQPGDIACANAVATQVIAGNANRLTVTVRAPSSGAWTSGTVRIGTTAVGAASGLEFDPGDSYSADFTGPVFIYNNSGAAISIQVLEVAK